MTLTVRVISLKQQYTNQGKIAEKERDKTVENNKVERENSGTKEFVKKHKAVFIVFIVAAILAAASAVYVFVWFAGNAQSSGLIPSSLGNWSMGDLVTFILNVIFWELVLVGIPVAIGAAIGWYWWKRLPESEKYNLSGKRSKSRGASGGFSLLLFIAFALKVYLDGNWNESIASWNVDYVIGSMITILIWIVAIAAIPAIIGLVWWLNHEAKNQP